MWKGYTERRRIKMKFRLTLNDLQQEFNTTATELKETNRNQKNLAKTLNRCMISFAEMQNKANMPTQPVDIFSSHFLELLFRRYDSQIDLISRMECFGLYQLSPAYDTDNDHSSQVDATLVEIGHLAGKNLSDVKEHLHTRIATLLAKEEEQEREAYDAVLKLNTESMLISWINRHLSAVMSKRTLVNLSMDLQDSIVYFHVLTSLCPELTEKAGAYFEETSVKERACQVLGIFETLGCPQLMNVQEYIANGEYQEDDDGADVRDTAELAAQRISMEANPDLHLCAIASLFLHKSALPASSSSNLDRAKWKQSVSARVTSLAGQWAAVRQKQGISRAMINTFLASVAHIGFEIEIMSQRYRRREKFYKKIRENVESFLWDLLQRQMSGKHSLLVNANRQGGQTTYNELPLAKILDVLQDRPDPNKEYANICNTVGRHSSVLLNIFRHYAAGTSQGGPMSFTDFNTLLKDCKLFPSKRVTKGVINVILNRVKQSLQQTAQSSTHLLRQSQIDLKEDDREKITKKNMLSSGEMIEAVIRVGIEKYSDVLDKSERVRRILESDILPNANRSKLDEFRDELQNPRVKKTWITHKAYLTALFNHYGKGDSHEDKKHTTMTKTEFLMLAEDAGIMTGYKLYSQYLPFMSEVKRKEKKNSRPFCKCFTVIQHMLRPLSEGGLKSIFAKVLQLNGQSEYKMGMTEFEQSLAACAFFKIPDPYVPLSIKVPNSVIFCNASLLSALFCRILVPTFILMFTLFNLDREFPHNDAISALEENSTKKHARCRRFMIRESCLIF